LEKMKTTTNWRTRLAGSPKSAANAVKTSAITVLKKNV
jgi:hypothetical protein